MAAVIDLGPMGPDGCDRRVACIHKHSFDGVIISIWYVCQLDKPRWSVLSEFKEPMTNSYWQFGNFASANEAKHFLEERGHQWLSR